METAGTEWIRAETTAEAFRAPEDAAGRARMITTGGRGRGAMTGAPTVEDEVLAADGFQAVSLI